MVYIKPLHLSTRNFGRRHSLAYGEEDSNYSRISSNGQSFQDILFSETNSNNQNNISDIYTDHRINNSFQFNNGLIRNAFTTIRLPPKNSNYDSRSLKNQLISTPRTIFPRITKVPSISSPMISENNMRSRRNSLATSDLSSGQTSINSRRIPLGAVPGYMPIVDLSKRQRSKPLIIEAQRRSTVKIASPSQKQFSKIIRSPLPVAKPQDVTTSSNAPNTATVVNALRYKSTKRVITEDSDDDDEDFTDFSNLSHRTHPTKKRKSETTNVTPNINALREPEFMPDMSINGYSYLPLNWINMKRPATPTVDIEPSPTLPEKTPRYQSSTPVNKMKSNNNPISSSLSSSKRKNMIDDTSESRSAKSQRLDSPETNFSPIEHIYSYGKRQTIVAPSARVSHYQNGNSPSGVATSASTTSPPLTVDKSAYTENLKSADSGVKTDGKLLMTGKQHARPIYSTLQSSTKKAPIKVREVAMTPEDYAHDQRMELARVRNMLKDDSDKSDCDIFGLMSNFAKASGLEVNPISSFIKKRVHFEFSTNTSTPSIQTPWQILSVSNKISAGIPTQPSPIVALSDLVAHSCQSTTQTVDKSSQRTSSLTSLSSLLSHPIPSTTFEHSTEVKLINSPLSFGQIQNQSSSNATALSTLRLPSFTSSATISDVCQQIAVEQSAMSLPTLRFPLSSVVTVTCTSSSDGLLARNVSNKQLTTTQLSFSKASMAVVSSTGVSLPVAPQISFNFRASKTSVSDGSLVGTSVITSPILGTSTDTPVIISNSISSLLAAASSPATSVFSSIVPTCSSTVVAFSSADIDNTAGASDPTSNATPIFGASSLGISLVSNSTNVAPLFGATSLTTLSVPNSTSQLFGATPITISSAPKSITSLFVVTPTPFSSVPNSTTPLFGATTVQSSSVANVASLFGATTGNILSVPNSTTSVTPLCGANTLRISSVHNPATSVSPLFGASSTSVSAASIFGFNNAFVTTLPSSTSVTTTSSFVFGIAANSSKKLGAANTSTLFGATQNAFVFGGATTAAFSMPAAPNSSATNSFVFGTSVTSAPELKLKSTPVFGNTSNSFVFGATNNSAPVFSASSSTAFNSTTNAFVFGAVSNASIFGGSSLTMAPGFKSNDAPLSSNNSLSTSTLQNPLFGSGSSVGAFSNSMPQSLTPKNSNAPAIFFSNSNVSMSTPFQFPAFGNQATCTVSSFPQSFGLQSSSVFGTQTQTSSASTAAAFGPPKPFVFGASAVPSTSSSTSGIFQFGSSSSSSVNVMNSNNSASGFQFGSATSPFASSMSFPASTNSTGFGFNQNPQPAFGQTTNTFGFSSNSSPSQFNVSKAPTFGSISGNPVPAFGQAPSATTGFNFGQSSVNNPAQRFNFNANFNFGGQAMSSPTFGSSPSANFSVGSGNTLARQKAVARKRTRGARR